jgi:predicted ATPase/DNA-binding SARP family transcriptional activator/tetratricopeptide (TPR) repeat protein
MHLVARHDRPEMPPVMVCVLGPVLLRIGGDLVDVPGPKRQALLALLAEAEGQTVSADRLVDALWPHGAPASARGTLQSHVSRLRDHLGSAAGRLEHGAAGYRLMLADHGTDAAVAASLLAEAAHAEPRRAFDLLSQARSLWRGPPLAGLEGGNWLTAWSVRLDALRAAVDSAFVDAALGTGALDDAVDVARTRAASDPLSERGAIDLMRVLAASGRIADALRVAYDHRQLVVAETGFEPSEELRSVESAIAAAAPTTGPRVVRPPVRIRGRDREIATLQRLAASERCVTVLGPGGVGKTTLAMEVASRIEPAAAVRLATVPPNADITAAVADALGLQVTHGNVLDACTALLGAGPRLLVLDGCEHVIAGVRSVVSHLLDCCPDLTVLSTSREPLALATEQRLRIGPLAVAASPAIDRIDASPAVALFLDRWRRIDASLPVGSGDLDLVVDIVRRLEGMPLAIELAAGRLSSLGLADLHRRLDDALDVLEGGEIALRQTIAWSYDLLRPDEQRLLRHLSVFPDGVDVDTVEAVAADLDLGPSAHQALSHLVDASMLVRVDVQGTVRYRQLDVMRAFAAEELASLAESDEASERLIDWGLALADWIDSTIDTAQEPQVDAALRRELPNLRAIWTMLRAGGRFDDAMRLAMGVSEAAGWRDITEVWGWLLDLATDPLLDGHKDEAALLGSAASAAWSRGELDRASSLIERGRVLGGPAAWRCDAAAALVSLSRGDLSRAAELAESAGDAATRSEQSFGVGALAAAYHGELQRADRLHAKLHAIAGSPTLSAFDSYVAGEIAGIRGAEIVALHHYERAIATARECGATFVEGIASVGRLTTVARTGRTTDALLGSRDLIGYWNRTDGWVQQWTTLRNLASLLLAMGDERTAVMLTVAADAAPDAPPLAESQRDLLIDEATRRTDGAVVETAVNASRTQVLAWANRAIDALC